MIEGLLEGTRESMKMGSLRTLHLLVVMAILAAGGAAFWGWRKRAKQTWIFLGSLDGIGLDETGLDWMLDPAGYRVEVTRQVDRPATAVTYIT